MSEKFIRAYKKLDIYEIKGQLLIYGDLSAQCAHCQTMDLRLEQAVCPQCKVEFKYITFRNVRNHFPKLQKIHAERPGVQIIDFDDYKREMGALKAKEFLQ
jgi:hypothetical protein